MNRGPYAADPEPPGVPHTVKRPPRRCACCGNETWRWMCAPCRSEHGDHLPAGDAETWEPQCETWKAASQAYHERLASKPAPPKVSAEALERARRFSI